MAPFVLVLLGGAYVEYITSPKSASGVSVVLADSTWIMAGAKGTKRPHGPRTPGLS
jgi:hypothetical protein